jgi:hypothetical protein
MFAAIAMTMPINYKNTPNFEIDAVTIGQMSWPKKLKVVHWRVYFLRP